MTLPRKSLGQNFLVDSEAVRRIVAALAVRPAEPILEIGPGRGVLTVELLRVARRVAVVELDSRLAQRLRKRFDRDRLVVFEQDVLRLRPSQVLAALGAFDDARLVVAGNLPYAISKPIVQLLIRERCQVQRAVLMFQREVAQRLTAGPGSRRYGPLGILAGRVYRIEALFDLPPRSFAPRPAVFSTVTRWTQREGAAFDAAEEGRLRRVLAVCFAHRRRTLRNNLRRAIGGDLVADRLLDAAEIDGSLRAEAVPPDGFLRLAAFWPEASLL